MKRASRSLASSLGVVPDAISEWKPEMAPHAIVMNTNGNTLPPKIGPVPSMNCVSAGICTCGFRITMAIASATIVPIFMNVDR
jgi:hypothetical protein